MRTSWGRYAVGPTSWDIKSLNPISLAPVLFSLAATAAAASPMPAPPPPLPQARAACRCSPEGISDACTTTFPRRLPHALAGGRRRPDGDPQARRRNAPPRGDLRCPRHHLPRGFPTSAPPAAPTALHDYAAPRGLTHTLAAPAPRGSPTPILPPGPLAICSRCSISLSQSPSQICSCFFPSIPFVVTNNKLDTSVLKFE